MVAAGRTVLSIGLRGQPYGRYAAHPSELGDIPDLVLGFARSRRALVIGGRQLRPHL
ncbi:hypothetical protein [Intrasporangium sp.]|uniref:hypothetical protein n=1 Tax=Intrasporangium sp. TaxID=1925024 RepID=UPI003221E732